MRSPFRFLALSLVAVIAAACTGIGAGGGSSPSEPPAPTGIVYPTGASDLVLRLRYVGGFIAPAAHLLSLPAISVYGDGTVIVPGPQVALYPGPALPNLQRATITPAGMQKLLEAAKAAGLFGPDARYDLGGIMDAGTAEFTVNADGRIHTVSAYALMEGGGSAPGMDPATAAARGKLAIFQAELGNPTTALGPEIGEWSAYQADAIQVLVTPGGPDDGQGLSQNPIAWPLSTPLATFGDVSPMVGAVSRCGAVTGSDLATLLPLFEDANTLAPWTDGDAAFGLLLRPLLPGEAACPTTVE